MNKTFVAILGIILVVMGGSALFVFQQKKSTQPAASALLGQPLLKGLKASEISSIAIREPKQTLTLAKKDERWTIAEKNGFPADLDKVTELVVKAIELKAGQVEPIGEKDRAQLLLADKGEGAATTLSFKAADGKILAELLVGKKYFKTQTEGDTAKMRGDGRFVLLPGDPKQVYIVADPLALASAASGDWISREGFAIERVKSLEVKRDGGEGYRIERTTDGVDWRLDGISTGQKLDPSRANAASYSLAKVGIEDLAAPDADTGLGTPTATIVAHTFDGLTYALTVGRTDKDRTYLKLALEGKPARESTPPKDEKAEDKEKREKAFAEEMKKLEARVAREAALADHVLVVPAAKLADTLKKRAELLEQKKTEAAKK